MFRQFLLPRHVLPQWLTVCKRHLDQTDKTDIHWGGECCSSGAFYLFCFNRLAFLCCSEAGCGPIVCACLKEKEAGSLYRDCNSYYFVLIFFFFLIFFCFFFFFFFFFFFCFICLVFLLFLETVCGEIVFSCFNEKDAGSFYRDCNSYCIVLICCFLLIF